MKIWNAVTGKWEEQTDNEIKKNNKKNISTNKISKEEVDKLNNVNIKYANKPLSNLSSAPLGKAVSNIFQTPENFKDGYQIGDVSKTIGSTALDLGTKTTKGIFKFGENIGDLAQYAVAQGADLLGADDAAEAIRKNAQFDATNFIFAPAEQTYSKNSVAGDTARGLAEGAGTVIAMANGGALLPKSAQTINVGKFALPTTSIISGAGSGITEAYNNGATDGQAWGYGISAGLAESFSESLFSGLGGKFTKVFGKGALDDAIIKKATDKIANRSLKILAQSGLKAAGEGFEEVISGFGNAVAKKLTYLSDEDFSKIVQDENLMDQFIQGTMLSMVMQTPGTIQSVNQNRDYITGKTSFDEAMDARKKYTENNQVLAPLSIQNETNNTNISGTQNIQKNGVSWQGFTEQNFNQDGTTTNFANNRANDKEYTPYVPIKGQENLDNNRYQYKQSKNQKVNALNESMAQNNFDNSQSSKDLANVMTKLIEDKGYNVLFDDSIVNQNGNSVNAQIRTLENGEVEIRINPNSERAGEFLLMHEVTHAIETDSMKNLILDFASRNQEFKTALESLKQTYGTEDVSSEVVADISGQLLGNQEFINSLSLEQPSLFKQIYNKIIELANKLTGNSNQVLFMKDLKNKWETAYRNSTKQDAFNNLNDKTQYSQKSLKDGTQYVETEKNLFIKEDGSSMSQREVYKSLLGKQITFNDGITATIVNRLPSKDMYNELFKRLPTYQNVKNIKNVNNTINENVIELLENSKNISPNEPDYMNRHQKQGISSFDTRLVSFFDGNNAYDLTFSIAKLNNGQYIAYAKRNLSSNNKLLNKIKKEMPTSKSRLTSLSANNIPQSNNVVKSDTSSTKYSMQEIKNDTQELDNSSFSLDKNAKRYDDLIKARYIEYFTKDNGDVRINIMDSNNNLVNQFDLYNQREAINQLGEELGKKIYQSSNVDNQRFNIGNDINNLGTDTDYFMTHRPTKTGITADNLINQEVETPMPKDIYEHPDWYFQMDEKYSQESMTAIRKVKGKPDAEITIYRATPGKKINEGDWVTLSKAYAEHHNKSQFDGKANILEMKVKAKDVQYAGDDINEFGYFPNQDVKKSMSNNTWQEHLEKNYKSSGTRTNFNNMMPYATKEINTIKNSKNTLNPNEISKLIPEDANTTPKLKNVKVSTGEGKSKFFDNILDKTDMLSFESKKTILSDNDVKYYQEVTNKESLEKAFERLNKNGASEAMNWLSKSSEAANSTDIAEGWILLKQYQDNIEKTTDIATKNDLNRSMVQIAKKMRDMGTKAGQTVQAFNILNRLTPEGMVYYAQSELSEAYDNMIKNKTKDWIDKHKADFELSPSETQFIMDTMQKISNMKEGYDKKVELAKIQKLMTDKLPPERGAGTKAWMRISMLFNPKTQVRNVLGNAVIAPVNSVSDLVASGIDKLISTKTGVRTTGTTKLKAYGKGLKTGLSQSYNDFKLGINTRNIEGNRFEISQGRSFNNKGIGKTLNKVDNLLSFLLDAGDRGFYEASFNNSINNQMILNNTNEITQDMIDIATTEALSRTWQDSNNYTQFVLNVRKGLNKINVKGYGLGDVLIPFAKTPANLTKAIVDYSPLGLINTVVQGNNLKKSLSNGQYTPQMQHKFVQDLGKATAGTMLYILGYALAKAGIVSGESDEDKDVSNFMKNTLGVNSYSIKIGNKSFTYDWAQPIAAPLSIMANYVQKDNEDANMLEKAISSMDTAGNILLEQSFMESINTVLNNNDGIVSGLQEAIMELPSRAIPTFMKQITDLTDRTQRQTYIYNKPLETMINKIAAKVPGASQTLAPSVDTLGREIKKYGGKNNIFNVFINPANVNTENISESAEEIYRLYKATGDTTIMPRVSPYYINYKGEKIILNAEEKAEFQKKSGDIIEKNVKKLLKEDNYKNLSNEDKASVISEIVNYSYNKARFEVLNMGMSKQYNKVNEYVNNGGKVYNYYLNKDEINYSLENPEKYNTVDSFGFKYSDYFKYQSDINKLKSSCTSTAARKEVTFNYINSLPYNKYQKIILFKLIGGYGIKDYRNEIYQYINGLKLTKIEKEKLWKYLYS